MSHQMENLGTQMLWGLSPAINAFEKIDIDLNKEEKELNLLFSENGGDARNILKTCSDIVKDYNFEGKPRSQPINIYVHETCKENLARTVLFLTLICETGLS
jgi:hypothetical protein